MVVVELLRVARLERSAAGQRRQFGEQRRTLAPERDRIDHHVGRGAPGRAPPPPTPCCSDRCRRTAAPARAVPSAACIASIACDDRVVQRRSCPTASAHRERAAAAPRDRCESGASTSISAPMPTIIDWSCGTELAEERPRAALIAGGNCLAPMLKLRSSASATDSGKSPAAKADTACGWPSSSTVKSCRRSPRDRVALRVRGRGVDLDTLTPERELAPSCRQQSRAPSASSERKPTQGDRIGLPRTQERLRHACDAWPYRHSRTHHHPHDHHPDFGASRLPEIGRGIGKGIQNFKESTREGATTVKPREPPARPRPAASRARGPATPAAGSHTSARSRSVP